MNLYEQKNVLKKYDTLWKLWETKQELKLNLEIHSMAKGKSAVSVLVKSDTGEYFSFGVSEFVKLTQNATINKGKVSGIFKIVKQGSTFSLSYMKSHES